MNNYMKTFKEMVEIKNSDNLVKIIPKPIFKKSLLIKI